MLKPVYRPKTQLEKLKEKARLTRLGLPGAYRKGMTRKKREDNERDLNELIASRSE